MRRLVYAVAVLVAAIMALTLNLRAAHVFALFPERTISVTGVVSGHSTVRAGRIRIAPGWKGTWSQGWLCGLDPCWNLAISDEGGSDLAGRARLKLAELRLGLEEIGGVLRGTADLPTLGAGAATIRVDAGSFDLALISRTVLSGKTAGHIERLDLQGLALGTGPVTLSVPAPNRIRISARLDGGPSPIEAEIAVDLDASDGTLDVTIENLEGFPDDLQRVLLRVTTSEDGGRRHLRLRFAL